MKKLLAISAVLLSSSLAVNAQIGMYQFPVNSNVSAYSNDNNQAQGTTVGTKSVTASNDKAAQKSSKDRATHKSGKDSRVTGEAVKPSVS